MGLTQKKLILSNEAEEVLDETAKSLVASAFGAFDDASKYVSDAVARIDEAGGKDIMHIMCSFFVLKIESLNFSAMNI